MFLINLVKYLGIEELFDTPVEYSPVLNDLAKANALPDPSELQ